MEKYSFDDREQFVEEILLILENGSSNDIKIQLREAFKKIPKKNLTLGVGGEVKFDQILTFSKLFLKCISSHSKSI